MKATPNNTNGQCERCRQAKPFVLASAFQGDGTATFRYLCARCERMERSRNQTALFAGHVYVTQAEVIEEFEEPAPRKSEKQLGLFTFSESGTY
jgi:late competence protein required for DNA uptake (superfamily II DNA/RNA helicase)